MSAQNKFFPITTAFIVNGEYVQPGPYLADLNTDYINLALVSQALDENDNKIPVFEIHYRQPYAIRESVYVFRTGGQTIDDLYTWLATYTNALRKYTGLKAVNIYNELKTPYKTVIINDDRITQRELKADTGDTNLYLDGGITQKDSKILTVEGDQTNTNRGVGYPGPGVLI